MDGVGDVAGALDEAVAIDVGVSSSGDSVSGAHFLLLGVAVGVSVAVLAQSVLSVVLAGGGSSHSYGHGSHGVVDCHGGGMGYSDGSGGNGGGSVSYCQWGSSIGSISGIWSCIRSCIGSEESARLSCGKSQKRQNHLRNQTIYCVD
ncbi:hypothetical protein C0J52_27763 [Blattella germanica]|nr:hypothetical protein C0J52_27763 [Blattella germanica]